MPQPSWLPNLAPTVISLLLVLVLSPQPSDAVISESSGTTSQFQTWYRQYGDVFRDILANNCTAEYSSYLKGVKDSEKIDWLGGADYASALTQPVMLCILNHTSDYIKSAMSSAQVLLGVTPTILAILGSSSTELAMVGIIAQRPILSLLLALGSPSIYMSRAFEYTDPAQLMQDRRGRLKQNAPCSWKMTLLTIVEYVVALAAMANVATIAYDLGTKTICSIWSDSVTAPLLWWFLVIPLHAIGCFCLRIQIRRKVDSKVSVDSVGWRKAWANGFMRFIREVKRTEFQPACSQLGLKVTIFQEGPIVVIVLWLLSTGVVFHVLYGTIVLSSLYFIGPSDALQVIARLMASVLICRVICMYEIAGLRENCKEIEFEYEEPENRFTYNPVDER